MQASISVVIPALNEEARIGAAIRRLQGAGVQEVIVADGGSADRTAEIAAAEGARVLRGRPNRGRQQRLGAQTARGGILLFLHADTLLPAGFAAEIRATLARRGVSAGAFRFRLDGDGWPLRLVELAVALRCRLLRAPYGDQAIFVTREAYERAGGFADMPVMEDFDLLRRLGRLGRIEMAPSAAVTSARRWERDGVWRVTWTHQLCILGYYCGVSPERLAQWRSRSSGKACRT